jgi:acyl carrier protein
MRARRSTVVPRSAVAAALSQPVSDLDSSESLYSRVLDEEIILEENVDDDLGKPNVLFVYDRFAEYVLALTLYRDQDWDTKDGTRVLDDVKILMAEEREFATLRGALEFLVLRLEDFRLADGIHFEIIWAMIAHDWKWRRIGALLAFQLDAGQDPGVWAFIQRLSEDRRDFVRRIVADQVVLLAHGETDRVLDLLNRLCADQSKSVREASRLAILGLPAPVALREVDYLQKNPGHAIGSGELLLYPADRVSPVLQNKVRWLVEANSDARLQAAVLGYLQDLYEFPYNDLFAREELVSVFRELSDPNASTYIDQLEGFITDAEAALRADLAQLEVLCTLLTQTAALVVDRVRMRRADPAVVLTSPLDVLIPDQTERASLLAELGQRVGDPGLDRYSGSWWPAPTLVNVVWRAAVSGNISGGGPADGGRVMLFLRRLGEAKSAAALVRLWQVASHVLAKAEQATGAQSLTLLSQFGQFEGAFRITDRARFCTEMAGDFGLTVRPSDERAMSSLGRLVLWIWDHDARLQQRQSTLAERIRQLGGSSPSELRERFGAYEEQPMSHAQQTELGEDLYAAYHVGKDNLDVLRDICARLIIWHEDRDSAVMSERLEALHSRDSGAFWALANALLTHADQRVVDVTSRVMERSEYLEQQYPDDILEGLVDILEEIVGVLPTDVQLEARFEEDLEVDSLSMIEIVVATEERYGIALPDQDIAGIRTVGQLVDYIRNAQARTRVESPER